MAEAAALGLGCRLRPPTEYGLRLQTAAEESLPRTLPKYSSLIIPRKRRAPASDLPLSKKQSMIMAARSALVQNKGAAQRLRLSCRRNEKEEGEKRRKGE